MALVIECPNGCRLRASEKKAGKVVKCPVCKSMIQIAPLSEAKIEVTRSLVKAKPYVGAPDGDSKTSLPVVPPTPPDPSRRLAVARHDPRVDELPEAINVSASNALPESIEIPDFEPSSSKATIQEIKSRTQSAREDRLLLSRVYASLLLAVGLMNLMPSLVSWFQALQADTTLEWTRWMFVQVFIAGLHFIYAVFLLQISDWSALRTVAVAALVIAVLFGIVATGLLTGGSDGQIARALEIRFGLLTRASYWCVAMLVLTTLFSFIAGKEASNWKRTEELLDEIVAHRATE